MDKASQIIERLAEFPFQTEHIVATELIKLGQEFGLPDRIPYRRIDKTEPCGGEQVSIIIGQLLMVNLTSLTRTEDGWLFSSSTFANHVAMVGDWWPILAYLRLEALVGEISTTYVGLDLGEHLELAKALGLFEQLLGKPYHPNADAPVPRTVAMTLAEFLKACTSPHRFFETCFTLYNQGDAIKYELRFDKLHSAVKAMVEALDQRLKNLEVTIPPA